MHWFYRNKKYTIRIKTVSTLKLRFILKVTNNHSVQFITDGNTNGTVSFWIEIKRVALDRILVDIWISSIHKIGKVLESYILYILHVFDCFRDIASMFLINLDIKRFLYFFFLHLHFEMSRKIKIEVSAHK